MNDLTVKQQRFVEEYTCDFDAAKSAIRAGYSENSARAIGSENLSKPAIKAAIKIQLQELSAETFITREVILTGLLKEALDRGDRSSHASRVAAWQHLAKVAGLFVEDKPHDDVAQLIRDITANNAANRKSLLPKDNIDMSQLPEFNQD